MPPQQDIAGDTPLLLGLAVFAALVNPRLLDVMECVIGPEIYSNPVQHVRIKPPAASLTSGPDDDVVTGLHGRTIDGRVASAAAVPKAGHFRFCASWPSIAHLPCASLGGLPAGHDVYHLPVHGPDQRPG